MSEPLPSLDLPRTQVAGMRHVSIAALLVLLPSLTTPITRPSSQENGRRARQEFPHGVGLARTSSPVALAGSQRHH